MAIQIRRGNYNDMNAGSLLDGELCATTQNDPNTSDGRATYIKNNGVLKRFRYADETEPYKEYTQDDYIEVSAHTDSVDLFTGSADDDEYFVVIDGATTTVGGALLLQVDDTLFVLSMLGASIKLVIKFTKIAEGHMWIVETNNQGGLCDVEGKNISLITQGAPQINAGTEIYIYSR